MSQIQFSTTIKGIKDKHLESKKNESKLSGLPIPFTKTDLLHDRMLVIKKETIFLRVIVGASVTDFTPPEGNVKIKHFLISHMETDDAKIIYELLSSTPYEEMFKSLNHIKKSCYLS